MARLRNSLVSAINFTKEEMKKKNITLEEAAKQAASTYKENEGEIISHAKIQIEKESHKTGKVGRPTKNTSEAKTSNNATKISEAKTAKQTKTPEKQVNKTTTKTKVVADAVKDEAKSQEKIKKNTYTFNGIISAKIYGSETKLNMTIPTKETDFNKAKEAVMNKLYSDNLLAFISNKDFERSLTTC